MTRRSIRWWKTKKNSISSLKKYIYFFYLLQYLLNIHLNTCTCTLPKLFALVITLQLPVRVPATGDSFCLLGIALLTEVTRAETWEGLGDGPQQIWGGGDGPCIRPPNILRSSVGGCARKYEQSKKGVIKELFSKIGVFLVKKGPHMRFHT